MPPEEFAFAMTLMVSGIALVFFFAVPIRRALLRKIEGTAPTHDAQLEAEVDQLRIHMGELEERLEFAERLLARQRDTSELPPGSDR